MANSKSVVGIRPDDSLVVTGYQVDELTQTWSVECFIAWSHIYPGFMGKVSAITHFPLKPGCQNYTYLDQAVEDTEHDLDSILTDSADIPEIDASFDEADTVPSSVFLWFLCLVSPHSDNFRLQFGPSIKCTLWCQDWALPLPVPQAGKNVSL